MLDVLRAWLGEGGTPVDYDTAATRLAVCLHCIENKPGRWWEVHFKQPIALEIRKHLEVKHQLHLNLPNEDQTGMCKVCGCCLRLKFWCPEHVIKEHTDPALKEKFPTFCWMRKIL